jgi:hypothetical protein
VWCVRIHLNSLHSHATSTLDIANIALKHNNIALKHNNIALKQASSCTDLAMSGKAPVVGRRSEEFSGLQTLS